MPGERLPTEFRGQEEAGECVSDELLLRYLDGAATPEEVRVVQKHLLECKTCFDVVAAVVKDSLHVPSEAEWVEFDKTVKSDPEKQIAGIISRVNELFPTGNRKASEETEEPIAYSSAMSPTRNIWESLQRWFEAPRLAPKYIFALSGIILSVLAVFIIYEKIIKNDIYAHYVYDDKVPYEYAISSLRSTSEALEADALVRSFISRFKLGISDYMIRNYQGAISTFETLKPEARMLQVRLPNGDILPWIRDFYFYQGVSHLALLRSKRRELDQSARSRHTEEAIQSLMRADSLVRSNNLEGSDREAYFLGLAYGFGGQQDSAIVQLHQIKPGNRFYKDSVELINKWSNK